MDAKTGIAQGRCISKIQDGRHLDLRYALLIEQKRQFFKKCLKIIRFHTRPDVAGGKVSPGRGI